MSNFGLLGFIFGCFAFAYAVSNSTHIEKKYRDLEQRVKELEEKENSFS
ncbi:hypothetical protein ACFP7A_12970 [Sporolactobacillus kofuensis]|uniref:Uncharacterized protein n=1 Tax=Sporolactobacillus kofuensis TaxID=269672 RepID=A0ABW1WJE2_9BACL|nr:hypothetical protein [Sporolactobacillus kofuensis]MCO7176961.1 hypothetical protein [Sporolactobacillus kofuensis]